VRPADRAIRDQLRMETAQLPVPGDMWEKISSELDAEAVRTSRRTRLLRISAQWKPALALAAAAGIFWVTVVPSGSHAERRTATDPTPVPVLSVPGRAQDSLTLQSYREMRREVERHGTGEEAGTQPSAALFRPNAITAR
jgi:hypothetical protein